MEAMIFIWKSTHYKAKITHFDLDWETFASDLWPLFNPVVDVAIVNQVNVLALLVLAQGVDLGLGDTHLSMTDFALNVFFFDVGHEDVDDVIFLCWVNGEVPLKVTAE